MPIERMPIYQDGAATAHDVLKIATNGLLAKVGGLSGDANGRGMNPHSITTANLPGSASNVPGLGLSLNSNLTSGAYSALSFGHDDDHNGLIALDCYGGMGLKALRFRANGDYYDFPSVGNGNVVGPSPSVLGELASWNSLAGTLLRQGAATLTDTKTVAIAASGAALTAFSRSGYAATQILDYAFTASGAAAGATVYDSLRSVAHMPAASTVDLVNGIGSYIVMDTASGVGGFPAGVGILAVGVAASNDAKLWGINTLLTDTTTGAVSAGTGRALNNEFDFNVTSPNTTVLGLQLAGSSLAQPAAAYGVILQPLDSPLFGTVSRWSAFLLSVEGSTSIFASVGAKQHTGVSIQSQDFNLNFKDSTGADANIVITGSESGGLSVFSANSLARAVTILGGAGRFAVDDGGGFNINSRIVLFGSGATFAVGSDTGYTTQVYANASAATSMIGTSITLTPDVGNFVTIGAGHLRTSAGGAFNPVTGPAPGSPASGWYLYTDSGDGNKLKAKASTGTIVTLGTP